MNETFRSPSGAPAGALAGFKVIDLTRVLGGPYCTQILADYGADVIKVEPPQGDETRDWGPPFKDGIAAYFSGVNRNKRVMALDLRQEAGRQVLLRLLEDADVVIENFKAGSMERWGLGYEEVLRPRFPRLIHCAITGFGETGPFGGFPGYDAVAQALTGNISVNGSPGSGSLRIGIPLIDLGTGLYAAVGILAAAEERRRSGQGQKVNVSLFDTGVALQHPHAPNYFMSGQAPKLTGNSHPNISPYDQYPTKSGPIYLSIGNDRQFRYLCEELGRPELAGDARFLHNENRTAHRAELNALLVELLADVEAEDIAGRLLTKGAPAGAVLTVPEVMEHPHTKHSQMVIEKDGYRGTGFAIKFSKTPGELRSIPADFGASTRQIMAELGYGADEIEDLIAAGVVLVERKEPPG